MAATTFESALVADGALAVFAPDPATGTVVDRTGNYTATLQNGGTVTSDVLVPRAPGAISLDGSNDYVSTTFGTRRNLCTNPSFETNTTGWLANGAYTLAGATLTRVTSTFKYGAAALNVATTGTAYQGTEINPAALPLNVPHTASLWIKGDVGAHVRFRWADGVTGNGAANDQAVTLTASYQRVSATTTFSGTDAFPALSITVSDAVATNFQIDGVLIEQASSAGDYFDGSGHVSASGAWVPATDTFRTDLGDTAWTGTAHASTSTRAGRTNLMTNPSIETNTTGWTAYGASVTIAQSAAQAKFGSKSLAVTTNGASGDGTTNSPAMTISSSTTYTLTGYIWAPAGFAWIATLQEQTGAGAFVGNTQSSGTGTGGWQRFAITRAMGGTAGKAVAFVQANAAHSATTFYIDALLLEASSTVNSYFDGSGSVEHQGLTGWLGLEHASASDRGVYSNGTTRTFVAALKPDTVSSSQSIIDSDVGYDDGVEILNTATGVVRIYAGSATPAATFTGAGLTTAAQLLAAQIDEPANTAYVYRNGAQSSDGAETMAEQYPAKNTLRIGGASFPFDGLIGLVAIFDRALTSAQHRAYAELSLRGDPVISVREPAPAYQITATGANGLRSRWAADESDPDRVPSGETWTTSMPGGSDTLTCSLPRDPERSYSDLGLLTDLQVIRDGGRGLRYRLDEAPKVSGDQMVVEPAARGYRAALEDRADVRALFVDRGLSNWTDVSRGYRIAILGGGYIPVSAGSFYVDPNGGIPGIMQEVAFSGTHKPYAGNRYDAGEGLKIGSIYYNNAATGYTPPSASLAASLTVHPDPDTATGGVGSGDLEGTTSGTFTASTPHRYATAEFYWSGTAVTADAVYQHRWGQLAVYGDHNLTKYGTPGSFYTGQMLGWLIANRVGGLTAGTIEDGSFAHPHAAYTDPSTALAIVENLSRYEPLYDWFAFTDEFNFQRRGTYGKRWRARVGPSGLRSTGQTIDRAWNEVAVRVQDPAYGDRIVGPPDSAYSTTSADLRDDGDDNPATAAGVTRRALLDIGEGTIAGATEVGKRFLEETKAMDFAGQCALVGYVEDDAGIMFPVDEVRAGDEISFTDSTDPSWRRVSATSFVRATQTNSLTLDSPAPTMDALLARLQAVLIPLN